MSMPVILTYLTTAPGLFFLSASLYSIIALYLWQRQWTSSIAQFRPQPSHDRLLQFTIATTLLIHAVALYKHMFFDGLLYIGLGDSISVILWLTVMIYWLGHWFYPLLGLHSLVLPFATMSAALPPFLAPTRAIENTELWAFKLHLLIAMLAYSLFTIASLHVLLMRMLQRHLHRPALPIGLRHLPPLLTMEALLFKMIWAGFICLTLTLMSGIIFSEEIFHKAVQFNHKTVFGIFSWMVFATLLIGRHRYGWRGRIAIRWTLIGFLFLVLAYLGSKFVIEILLGRG
jgi:ABC-type uncharacterized transport system permease subunit